MLLYSYLLSFLFACLSATPSSSAANTSVALPGCRETCGNITVPYPFGIGGGCYKPGFMMTCNDSQYDPPKLFMNAGNIEITQLTFDNVFMNGRIARDCSDEVNSPSHMWIDLTGTPYVFSNTRNHFTVIGCDTLALIYKENDVLDFVSGCISLCRNLSNVNSGGCSGSGCCQTAIPGQLKRFDTRLANVNSLSTTSGFSPCSFAFLIDQGEFEFSLEVFTSFRERSRVPVVLDWAIGNQTCMESKRSGSFICGPNSNCVDSTNGPGYRCNCKQGYQGNPYLSKGCQDIDECEDPNGNSCVGICTNTPGSYICSCPTGSTGDGRRDGSGCTSPGKAFPLVQTVVGSGVGFLSLLVLTSLLYWALRRKRLILLREQFFKQNGGLLLQSEIASHEGAAEAAKIFTVEELKKATDNYSRSRVLGRGGFGTVYKGILPDERVVAIKKSMVIDMTQVEQFINEVVILSQVIHRNVVKILGCCLEMEVPMLVYEYVSNGTLHHHLHDPGHVSSLSWEARLRIAAETAGALAYLHSATARPIIHRDVKSSNILLNEKYTAKVSDFGASMLVPLDREHLPTFVQGTFGYLDPEYFQTGQLTEKSDVYSFGVVLLELLTGQEAISSERSEEDRSLAMYFIRSMESNQLFDILEPRVAREGERQQLENVARLAERCLKLVGDERPTMAEVAEELERARRPESHPWIREDNNNNSSSNEEETGTLLITGAQSSYHTARNH